MKKLIIVMLLVISTNTYAIGTEMALLAVGLVQTVGKSVYEVAKEVASSDTDVNTERSDSEAFKDCRYGEVSERDYNYCMRNR